MNMKRHPSTETMRQTCLFGAYKAILFAKNI